MTVGGGGQFPDNRVLISVVKGLIRSPNVWKRWEMNGGAIFCSAGGGFRCYRDIEGMKMDG